MAERWQRGGREGGGLFGFLVDANVRNIVLKKYNKVRNRIREELLSIGKEHLSQFKVGPFTGL